MPPVPPAGWADLHRHLDGSLRMDTLRELAARFGVSLPPDIRFHVGMGLDAALQRFATTLAVLQHPAEVRRVAHEICEDAAADGVRTLEIRFAPQLHKGAAPEAIVDAALEGANGRAGLILCGLYGEPPEVLQELVEMARTRPGVIGVDLAGAPLPMHRHRLEDYAPAFTRAAELGIGRTVHAGEGRPPDEIRVAVTRLGAQRIGHGTTLLQDDSLVDLLIERRVTVEACPTSNVHTSAIPSLREHPLAAWLRRGVRACICTDNTLLSDVTSTAEHEAMLTAEGMDQTLLQRAVECGHQAVFKR